jgi:hypothetical protein
MKRVAKWISIGIGGLVGLLALAAIGIFLVSGYMLGKTHPGRRGFRAASPAMARASKGRS